MTQPPTTHRTPTGAAADRVRRLADPDETQPLDVPGGPTGNGAPALSQPGVPAGPTPVATPVASANAPRDGDRAGAGRSLRQRDDAGRFIGTSRALVRVPPMGAALAEALLDAQAETHRTHTATQTAGRLVAAVAFEDLVRHSGGGGSA